MIGFAREPGFAGFIGFDLDILRRAIHQLRKDIPEKPSARQKAQGDMVFHRCSADRFRGRACLIRKHVQVRRKQQDFPLSAMPRHFVKRRE